MRYSEGLILRTPSEVVTPDSIIPAFECLEVIPGFRCSFCNSLQGTLSSIEKHCRAHTWTKPEGMNDNRII